MENENKQAEQQKTLEQDKLQKIKQQVEQALETVSKQQVQPGNVEYLYKLVDIHKDIANEEYWKMKEENMRYSNYGRDSYNEGSMGTYGRRRRDSRGRFMESPMGDSDSYGRRYRGEMLMGDMEDSFQAYSEGKEQYGRGNYSGKEESLKSLDYMLKSVVEFICMLQEEAESPEETQLIKKYARKISEM